MADSLMVEGEVLDGKYEIEGLIGKGGMGSVYRARHIRLDAPRAIKLMRDELVDDEDFVRRFRNEALLAEGVRHPNVVALFDFATLPDGTKYIVWEYVEGETVGATLERGEVFPPSEVVRLVGQVASGLAAAHQKGILHRDVSPDNIMLCQDENGARTAKLLDFGVAKVAGYPASIPTTPGMVVGKIGYASPEQMGLLQADELLDARTDVFSLAAVAYAMLVGESPFRTSSFTAFLHDLMIANEADVQNRFLAQLEPPWREPLSRALSREREARPSTIEGFASAMDRAGRGSTSGAAPGPPRRERWLGLVAFTVVAVVAVVAGSLLGSRLTPPEPSTIEVLAGAEAPHPLPPPEEDEGGDPDPPVATAPSASPPQVTRTEAGASGSSPPASSRERVAPPSASPSPAGRSVNSLEQDSRPRSVVGQAPASAGKEPNVGSGDAPDSPSGESIHDPGLASTTSEDATRVSIEEAGPAAPAPEPQTPKITPPEKLNDVQPVYPAIARRMRVEGDVVLSAVITEDGRVTELRVSKSIPLLDKAAIEAAKQWTYRPATENGVPIATRVTLTVSFRMTE